jgi:hypothetical protein
LSVLSRFRATGWTSWTIWGGVDVANLLPPHRPKNRPGKPCERSHHRGFASSSAECSRSAATKSVTFDAAGAPTDLPRHVILAR